MNKLLLVKIDEKYCDYLRQFDNKVPYNFDKKNIRPFIGVLFMVNHLKYFAPLFSPKIKHLRMNNSIDFLKINNGKLGAINFNNMIPVTSNNIHIINLKDKNEDISYLSLLKEQLYWLNRHSNKVYIGSKKLYEKYNNNKLAKNISIRCCNFKLLEEKCNEYNSIYIP